MRRGLSFTELGLMILIIGVIITITMPVVISTTEKGYDDYYRVNFKATKIGVGLLIGESVTKQLDSNFCTNFSGKVNTIGNISCTSSTVPGSPNFVTSNGTRWYGLEGDFSTNPKTITIDVNGTRNPNQDNKDLLKIKIYQNGATEPETGSVEENYV